MWLRPRSSDWSRSRSSSRAAAVPGVEKVTSLSQEGISLVTLRFAWGTDMDFAALNVRERLDNIRERFPETAERPTILRVDPQAEPILTVSLTGGGNLLETKEVAEDVFRRRLEQLEGVAQASVTGGLDREIQVDVDLARLESNGITLAQVSRALDQANYSNRGGTILRGRYRYPLRTLGEFQTVEEINNVIVGQQQLSGGQGQGQGEARPAGRRGNRVSPGTAERHRNRGGRLCRAGRDRAVQRLRVGGAPRLQGGRRQHGGGLGGRAGDPRPPQAAVSGFRGRDRVQPGRIHRRIDQQRGPGTDPGRAARLRGPLLLPARPALPGGNCPGDPDFRDRHLRAHGSVRRVPERHEPGGTRARGGHAGRQLDHRPGEHLPAPPGRDGYPGGRGPGRGRGAGSDHRVHPHDDLRLRTDHLRRGGGRGTLRGSLSRRCVLPAR